MSSVKTLEERTLILAPAESIWKSLVEFADYQQWNPWVTHVDGEPDMGARLVVAFGRFRVPAVVRRLASPREIVWEYGLPVAGMLTAMHSLRLDRVDGLRSRLVHQLTLAGWGLRLVPQVSLSRVSRGMLRMNRALLTRVEATT